MVKLHFDATAHKPWQGSEHDSPAQYALRLWMQYINADEDMDLMTACRLAVYDREVWDELKRWALSQDMEVMSDAVAAALGRALCRKPPRKRVGTNARRDDRLQAIADLLGQTFGIRRTRAPSTATASAASILADLPGTPSEVSINKILGKN